MLPPHLHWNEVSPAVPVVGKPYGCNAISLWPLPKHGKHANPAGASGAIRDRSNQRNICQRCFPGDDNQINVKERLTQMSSDMLTDVRVKFGMFTTHLDHIWQSDSVISSCCWRLLFCACELLRASGGGKLTSAKQQIGFIGAGGGSAKVKLTFRG